MISWSSMAPDRTLPEIRSTRTPMTKYAILFTLVNHPSFFRHQSGSVIEARLPGSPGSIFLEATSIGARGMPKHPHKNKGLLERFVLLCKMLQQNGLQF